MRSKPETNIFILQILFLALIGCSSLFILITTENKDGGDYQIYISGPDTLTIKDGSREVGKIFFTDDGEMGNLLQADNQ